MARRNKCGICKKKEASFYCILCDYFFCGNCNTVYHDEECPTKQRSSEFNENVRNRDSVSKWLENSDLFTKLESSNSLYFDTETIADDYSELTSKERKYIRENMSERVISQKKHSGSSRRAPVPCPRLPSSFRTTNQERNANYSYASIEFRPAIVTDDGVTAGPANDDLRETELLSDDLNNEDFQWEDEITTHAPVATDDDPYAEIEIGTGFDASRNRNGSDAGYAPKLPQRYNSDKRTDEPEEPRFEIYDDPADTKPNEKDLSQLYAVVDFSKKKKRSQKGIINPSDDVSPEAQPCQQNVENTEIISSSATGNAENEVPNNQIKQDVSKVGNSKFFVDIPESRKGAPPPVPKPFAARRKKSAPALLVHELPPLPPRTGDALLSDEKNYRSNEELNSSYAVIGEPQNEKRTKGHRRNLSGDLHIKSRDLKADLTNGVTDRAALNSPEKRSFKKKHRRMKSHETISTVFSPTQKDDKSAVSSVENNSTRSGQSSAESSLEDTASTSKESQDSVGNSYEDMSELMRKAEALISDELPEGWQEVRDGNEVYYWHIWTGTIQYERPVLSATPSSSSRSISPSFSDTNSSQSPSVSEIQDKGMQSKSPEARPESPHDKPKQAISFPVHSMGWTDVEEDLMSSNVLADTVNHCISSLAEQRKDLWKIAETWGEGKDIKLILEGESLKLVEPKSKALLLVQPIAKMRVWGVGKEDQRDFAYIARDPKTNKHKCHMFRCHGNVSGRSIANTLHAICNRVLEEKRRAKEKNAKTQKAASDLLNAPVSSSARGNTAFNEKPYFEQKKRFSAKYIGWTEVPKSSGIDTLNKAVNKLITVREPTDWKTVLVEITISEIKTIDCSTQEVLMEDRVRFISFLGVAKDERMCGYIVAVGMETFVCHVFCCIPHAGTLTRAIEEACKLRYEKFLHKNAEERSRGQEVEPSAPQFQQKPSTKEKSSALKSSVQGLFQKLQKRDSKKKDDTGQSNQDSKIPILQAGANEYLIKYFGCVQVELGTGIETVQESVEQLSCGAMMIGFLEVTKDGLTLSDSQRTALSTRVIDLDTVSYCGITSDKDYFGIIVSQGRGKYACHVFQEYKTPVGDIVSAIHAML